MLTDMTVVDYPNMKREDRRKLHKGLYKVAYPEQKPKIIKTTDVLNELKGFNNG